jgi:hypothetical protein
MYKVIKLFADLQDNNHIYNVGDIFPREGLEVSAARLAELSSSKNKQWEPLIALVKEAPKAAASAKKTAAAQSAKKSTAK